MGSVLGKLGVKANANMKGLAEGMESLGDPGKRRAFVHTARSVIDPKCQRVDASDRLYLSKDVPTLLVWGEEDHVIPVKHGEHAHGMMPHSRFEILPGAGHFSHNHDPERFVEIPERVHRRDRAGRPRRGEGAGDAAAGRRLSSRLGVPGLTRRSASSGAPPRRRR